MPIGTIRGDPCQRCGRDQWQVTLPDVPKSRVKSTLVTGGLMLAMLGVTVALSAAADAPVTNEDLSSVLSASDSDKRAEAVCANCRMRFALSAK